MKFMVSWTARSGGSSADAERDVKRGLDAFLQWTPPDGLEFHAFLQRADGTGGYAIVETDSAPVLLDSAAKFGPWFVFDAVPVMDMAEGVAVATAANEWRASIT